MSDKDYLGIIEGYYGTSYSKEERDYLCSFLKDNKYSFYIYAPKADFQLRDEWTNELTPEYREKLHVMRKQCSDNGLDFGIALSPLNLTAKFDEQKDLLLTRVKELCQESQCDIFCLLFDDMFKTSEDLGAIQNKIIKLVEKELPTHVKRFIICPTYYSYDPALGRIFGECPKDYFKELLDTMPERVDIFWTGPMVLSKDITQDHVEEVTKLLGRKPFIWDNYPVNDGKSICHYLFLEKFKGRCGLNGRVAGHAVNPMVQCVLSTLPAITLPLIYEGKSQEEINQAYLNYAKQILGKAAHELMKYDNLRLLTTTGLNKMGEIDKTRLLQFCELDKTPALDEIIDFLNVSMRFDQSIVNGSHPIVEADNATALSEGEEPWMNSNAQLLNAMCYTQSPAFSFRFSFNAQHE